MLEELENYVELNSEVLDVQKTYWFGVCMDHQAFIIENDDYEYVLSRWELPSQRAKEKVLVFLVKFKRTVRMSCLRTLVPKVTVWGIPSRIDPGNAWTYFQTRHPLVVSELFIHGLTPPSYHFSPVILTAPVMPESVVTSELEVLENAVREGVLSKLDIYKMYPGL